MPNKVRNSVRPKIISVQNLCDLGIGFSYRWAWSQNFGCDFPGQAADTEIECLGEIEPELK